MEDKKKPLFRRYDSQAEVYRKVTQREIRAVSALPPPTEPEPFSPTPLRGI